jgi:hypothetical protein
MTGVDLLGIVGMLFFALTLAAGWAIVSKLRPVLSTLEVCVASPIVGILFATWAALLVYLVAASLDLAIVVTSVLMLAVFIFLQPWKTTFYIDKKHLPGIALSVAAASIFMYFTMLTFSDGEYHIAFSLFGDAAFHSSLVTSFAQGVNYPPQYPMMAGTLLRYTFLIDFYSGILDRLGLGLQWSIVLPGIALLASLLALLYLLGCRFTGRRAGGFTVMALIIFSGGLEFIRAFTDWQTLGISLQEFLTTQNLNYTTMWDFNYVFTNFMIIVLAQRAALIGFAVGALIILICYLLYVDKSVEEVHTRKALAFAGLIAGLLPLFHTYSYRPLVYHLPGKALPLLPHASHTTCSSPSGLHLQPDGGLVRPLRDRLDGLFRTGHPQLLDYQHGLGVGTAHRRPCHRREEKGDILYSLLCYLRHRQHLRLPALELRQPQILQLLADALSVVHGRRASLRIRPAQDR